MKLTQMQDIAGCRAIMPNILAVRKLVEYYQRFGVPVQRDYLESPKENGYRSVHLVYKYAPNNLLTYNHAVSGNDVRRVEIQVRTLLQHYWATAVETAATFLNRALKATVKAQDDWEKFFVLASDLVAILEDSPRVQTLLEHPQDVRAALWTWINILHVKSTFARWANAISATVDMVPNPAMFLIALNLDKDSSIVTAYAIADVERATEDYFEYERMFRDNPQLQAVLVSAKSIDELQTAYPNYRMDSMKFVDLLEQVSEGA